MSPLELQFRSLESLLIRIRSVELSEQEEINLVAPHIFVRFIVIPIYNKETILAQIWGLKKVEAAITALYREEL